MADRVTMEIPYPEKVSRAAIILTIIRFILLIPQFIILAFWIALAKICFLVMLIIAIFTGSYPRSMFNFVTGCIKRMVEITNYCCLFYNKYPPFSCEDGLKKQ